MRRRPWIGVGVLALLCAAAVIGAPLLGAETISLRGALVDLLHGAATPRARILALRLPRVALGLLAGGSLAVAGAAFQTLLRNALATPYTLGVSFAGALGAFLAMSVPALSFAVGPVSSITLFAFLLAALDVAALYLLARRGRGIRTGELLLAGVTLNYFCGAAILLLRLDRKSVV